MTNEEKLQETLSGFENKWVAISPGYDSVLASADTLPVLLKDTKGLDAKPVFFKVLPKGVTYSPAHW